MDKDDVKKLIDRSIEIAMDKHNRNATIISAILGFFCLAAFVDGLFRILGRDFLNEMNELKKYKK